MYKEEINKKEAEILEYKSLLNRTDYHIMKMAEGETAGVAYDCPECIIHARRGAREKINELESEIGDLELLQEEYLKTIDEMEL